MEQIPVICFAEVEAGSTTVQDAVTATNTFIREKFTGQVLSSQLLNAVWVIYNRVSPPEFSYSLGVPSSQCASLEGETMSDEVARLPEGQTFINMAALGLSGYNVITSDPADSATAMFNDQGCKRQTLFNPELVQCMALCALSPNLQVCATSTLVRFGSNKLVPQFVLELMHQNGIEVITSRQIGYDYHSLMSVEHNRVLGMALNLAEAMEERERLDLELCETDRLLQEKVALVSRLHAGRYPEAKELEMKEMNSLSVTAPLPEKKQKAETTVEQVNENANPNYQSIGNG